MRYRELGKTGLKVSEIGFGTIPVLSGNVPVLPEYYSPDVDEAVDIMMHAYNMGCNLYDTAIPEEYGDAEYKLGVFAEKVGRENIIIADKARFMDGNDMFREVMRSAETLGTDPDIYFVHQVDSKNEEETFSRYGALDALCDLKRAEKIKYTGIATHYYSVAERAANDDRVDVIQMSGNIFERGMLDRMSENSSFRDKGVILNKVYAAGCLLSVFSPAELIGGILHIPFSCALIGVGTMEQADAAMKEEYPPLAYDNSFPAGAKFYVPDGSIELYQGVAPWSSLDVLTYSGSGPDKCGAPSVSYVGGKLSFKSDTPDVVFHYTITSVDSQKNAGNDIDISGNCKVSVYASKKGYEDSDTVETVVNIIGKQGDVNRDGDVNVADHVKLSDIIMNNE